MDRWGYCHRGVKEYLATERQTCKKNIDNLPLAPSKKVVIWTMQYVFVPGHVGCKKTVSAACQFRCHYKQLRDLEFRRLSPYVFFEFLGAKKLELEIFLTSDKMVFCRAWGPLSRRQTVPE